MDDKPNSRPLIKRRQAKTYDGTKTVKGRKPRIYDDLCVGTREIYDTPEKLAAVAKAYFEYCDVTPWMINKAAPKTRKGYVQIPASTPYSWLGLCVYMGVSRMYFNDLKDRLKEQIYDLQNMPNRSKYQEELLTNRLQMSELVNKIKDIISLQNFNGTAVGAYLPALMLPKLGIEQKMLTENVNYNVPINIDADQLKVNLDKFNNAI